MWGNPESGIRAILTCGIRNPRLWNPESTTLESGIQLMESRIQPLESRIQLVGNPACCDCSSTTFLLKSDYCVRNSSCEEVQQATPGGSHTEISVDIGYRFQTMQWRVRIMSWSCGVWNKGATGDSRSLVFWRTPSRLQSLSLSVRNWNQVSDFRTIEL